MLIPVPDDIPDEQLRDLFDQIESQIENQIIAREPTLPEPVRKPPWLTVREAAELLGISYPQMARWVNVQHLPFPAGDARNPWQPNAVPVDTSLGPRRRRIAVEGINPRYIRTEGQQRRLAELLATWPKRWKETHCRAPLKLTTAVHIGVGRGSPSPK
jgi:hypothetical protein